MIDGLRARGAPAQGAAHQSPRERGGSEPSPMKIHEYQAKAILAKYGVPVPQGEVVQTAADAAAVAGRLGGGVAVVKAQIHAGGRGKGGGVKVVKSPQEAQQAAEKILGMNLVTYQTGPRGQKVSRVLVEQGLKRSEERRVGKECRRRWSP